MDSMTEFVTQADRIILLEKQVDALEIQLDKQKILKHKAIQSRKKARGFGHHKAINVLINLCDSGKVTLTVKEMSELCFITIKSVWQAKRRLKQKEN